MKKVREDIDKGIIVIENGRRTLVVDFARYENEEHMQDSWQYLLNLILSSDQAAITIRLNKQYE